MQHKGDGAPHGRQVQLLKCLRRVQLEAVEEAFPPLAGQLPKDYERFEVLRMGKDGNLGAASTAAMEAVEEAFTATCRSTCSAGGTCCWPASGVRTSRAVMARLKRSRALSRGSARNGRARASILRADSAWHVGRKAEAISALTSMGILTGETRNPPCSPTIPKTGRAA